MAKLGWLLMLSNWGKVNTTQAGKLRRFHKANGAMPVARATGD
jgi:hypothetical protein